MRKLRFGGKQPQNERRHVRATQPSQVFSYYASSVASRGTASDSPLGRGADEARRVRNGGQPSAKGLVPAIRRFVRSGGLQQLPVALSVIALAVVVIYATILTPQARLVVMADQGVPHRSSQDYLQRANTLLAGSVFNRSKLLIDTNHIADELAQSFPEATDVSVTVPLMAHKPVVQIVVPAPVCQLQDSRGERYLIRIDGVASMKSSDAAGAVDGLPVVVDQTGVTVEIGKSVLSKEYVSFVAEIMRQFAAKGVVVTQMTLPATSPNELQARIQGVPYYVRFNTIMDPRQQAGTYLALTSQLTRDGVQPKEYVDLRVGERAYYK